MDRKHLEVCKKSNGSELSVRIESASQQDQDAMLLMFGGLVLDWDGNGMFCEKQGGDDGDRDCD